jgi:histone H3/H4
MMVCFCLLEYTTDVLEEAKLYSVHAGRKQVELEDIKLACQNWADEHSTMPSKDVRIIIILFLKIID